MNHENSGPDPQLLIEGHGERTLLLLHGWPDTLRVWDRTVDKLKAHYRCVRFTLPGFDPALPSRAYSLDDVMAIITRAVDTVSPTQPVTLLLHDWGCFFGYQYAMRQPQRVARVVGVDIGDAGSRAHRAGLGVKAIVATLAYQWWLALAWKIGGGTGDRMARWIARLFQAPAPAQDVVSAMGYPYAMQWFGVAGGFGHPRPFVPNVPMLFIHGERKPFSFHSSAWAERLAARPGSRVLGMPTGHWVMSQRPDEFNAAVLAWLQSTEKGAT